MDKPTRVQNEPIPEAVLDRLAQEAYQIQCGAPIRAFLSDTHRPEWRAVVQNVVNALTAAQQQGQAVGRAHLQAVLNLSEAARRLGVAQAKNDQGAIDYWTDKTNEYEAAFILAAQQPSVPTLAKHQPCGCVICTCEDEQQCQGCGAKHCGNRIDHAAYVEQQPAAVDEAMVERATMALLGKSHDTAPGIDWRCDRAWTVNKVRKHMRAALVAALAAQHQEPTT